MSTIPCNDDLIWDIGKGSDTAFRYQQKGFSLPKPLPLRFRKRTEQRKVDPSLTGTQVLTPEFVPQVHLVSAFPPAAIQSQNEAAQWRSEVIRDHGLVNIHTGEWTFERSIAQKPANVTSRGYDWAGSRTIRATPRPEVESTFDEANNLKSRSQHVLPAIESRPKSRMQPVVSQVSCRYATSTSSMKQQESIHPRLVRGIHENRCEAFLSEILGETSSLESTSKVYSTTSILQGATTPGILFSGGNNAENRNKSSYAPSTHIFSHTHMSPSTLRDQLRSEKPDINESIRRANNIKSSDRRSISSTATDSTIVRAAGSSAIRAASVAFGHIPKRTHLAKTWLKRISSMNQKDLALVTTIEDELTLEDQHDYSSPKVVTNPSNHFPTHIRVPSEFRIRGGYPLEGPTVLRKLEMPQRESVSRSSRNIQSDEMEQPLSISSAIIKYKTDTSLSSEDILDAEPPEDNAASDRNEHLVEQDQYEFQEEAHYEDQEQEDKGEPLHKECNASFLNTPEPPKNSLPLEKAESIDHDDLSEKIGKISQKLSEPISAHDEENDTALLDIGGVQNNENKATQEPQQDFMELSDVKDGSRSINNEYRTSKVRFEDEDDCNRLYQHQVGQPNEIASLSHSGTKLHVSPLLASSFSQDKEQTDKSSPRYFKTSKKSARALQSNITANHPVRMMSIPISIPNHKTMSLATMRDLLFNQVVLPESDVLVKGLSYSRGLQFQASPDTSVVSVNPLAINGDISVSSTASSTQPSTASSALPFTSIREWKKKRAERIASESAQRTSSLSWKDTKDLDSHNLPSHYADLQILGTDVNSALKEDLVISPVASSILGDKSSSLIRSMTNDDTSVDSSGHSDLVGSLANLTPEELEKVVRAAVTQREMRHLAESDGQSQTDN